MRLFGIDPNGLAQRVQFKIVKLLVANKPDDVPRSPAPANVQQLPTTALKVRIRNLPLPQSLQLTSPNDVAAKSPMTATANANADPVAVRAIARFTETQTRPMSTETTDIAAGTSAALPDTPALPTSAQISAMVHARQHSAAQPADASHTDGGRAAQLLAAIAVSHRGVAALLVVSGIALIVALI